MTHIAIEGMDGVGKTTAAKRLAEKLNFKFIEKPLHYIFDVDDRFDNYIKIRDYINEQKDNDVLRAWFYGLGNIYIYHRFKKENIITDRHLVSNYFWCGGERSKSIFKCMIDLIGKPDFTFLLYTTSDEGARRIRQRDPADDDIWKTGLYSDAKKKMESFLVEYSMGYQAIDTTNLDEHEVVDAMMKHIPFIK